MTGPGYVVLCDIYTHTARPLYEGVARRGAQSSIPRIHGICRREWCNARIVLQQTLSFHKRHYLYKHEGNIGQESRASFA